MKGFCDAVEGEVGVKGGNVEVGLEVWFGTMLPSPLV